MDVKKYILLLCLCRARSGWVSDFDWMRQRHTVRYDDDDVEVFPLWGPSQQARTFKGDNSLKLAELADLRDFCLSVQPLLPLWRERH